MKRILYTPFLLSMLPLWFLVSGCGEKGCTDPRAINYNSVASDDDGSCILCQQWMGETGNRQVNLIDYNSSSSHFNTPVALFRVRQLTESYNNQICGSKQCRFEISVESLVTQNMSFYYQLQCSGDIYFNSYRSIYVSPLQTFVIDTIPSTSASNPCGNLNACNINISTSGNISYW